MWTLTRRHRHLKPDTLAEYMDGRLGATARTRVDQQLASCGDCREELEELRATVSLLRQLPTEPVPHSFSMPAPPVEPISPRASAPLRVPQWVYAGAASAAVVVLAVLVSADATGLLEPATPRVAGETAVEADLATAATDQTTPIQTAAQIPAVTVEAEREFSLQAAAAPPRDVAAQAAPEAAMAAEAAQVPAAQVPTEAASDREMPSPMPAVDQTRDGEATEAPPPTSRTSAPLPLSADLTTADPGPGLAPPEEPGGTAMVWRVLEAIAAALGLVFLGGLLLHRRSQRGARRG